MDNGDHQHQKALDETLLQWTEARVVRAPKGRVCSHVQVSATTRQGSLAGFKQCPVPLCSCVNAARLPQTWLRSWSLALVGLKPGHS